MPTTTKERIAGASSVKTEQLHRTVVYVEGNRLVVRMSSGGMRTFEVPDSRRFMVDGKELTVGDLKVGTTLTATVSTTTTPVTERTTTVGTGKVWYVSGNTVILTLPNNENRMYKVNENYRFNVGGQPASVHELKKGMVIAAEKIVAEPKVEVASNTVVTGHAPPPPREPKVAVAAAPPAPVRETPVATRKATEPPAEPKQVAHTAAPAHNPAPAHRETLPATASSVPVIGLIGLLLLGAGLALQRLRFS